MIINNESGDVQADVPPELAALLMKYESWKKGKAPRVAAANTVDEAPIPMTHIPGVVAGVSMGKVRALVEAGTVPVVMRGRTKLLRPSDVRAALEGE